MAVPAERKLSKYVRRTLVILLALFAVVTYADRSLISKLSTLFMYALAVEAVWWASVFIASLVSRLAGQTQPRSLNQVRAGSGLHHHSIDSKLWHFQGIQTAFVVFDTAQAIITDLYWLLIAFGLSAGLNAFITNIT